MEFNNKIRAMRRVANNITKDETECYNDSALWGAPYECGEIINKNSSKRVLKALKKLDITIVQYDEELTKYISEEGKFSGENPPKAWYDLISIT